MATDFRSDRGRASALSFCIDGVLKGPSMFHIAERRPRVHPSVAIMDIQVTSPRHASRPSLSNSYFVQSWGPHFSNPRCLHPAGFSGAPRPHLMASLAGVVDFATHEVPQLLVEWNSCCLAMADFASCRPFLTHRQHELRLFTLKIWRPVREHRTAVTPCAVSRVILEHAWGVCPL